MFHVFAGYLALTTVVHCPEVVESLVRFSGRCPASGTWYGDSPRWLLFTEVCARAGQFPGLEEGTLCLSKHCRILSSIVQEFKRFKTTRNMEVVGDEGRRFTGLPGFTKLYTVSLTWIQNMSGRVHQLLDVQKLPFHG